MTVPGQFSPIEDVIREAEERAERDWRIEHEPCDHSWLDVSALNHPSRHLMCVRCGQEDTEPF